MNWTAISAWISAVGLIVTATSVWLALMEFRQNQDWNRRKASEETLSKLVLGEFPESLDQLVSKFKWDPIADSKNYDEIIQKLNEDERFELDRLLRRLLRILETLFIHVKHGILSEDICYDYLASIVPNLCSKCVQFIENERHARGDQRVFENFTKYAYVWMQRNAGYKDSRTQGNSAGRRKHPLPARYSHPEMVGGRNS
jgi:hypothetical protein